MTSGWQAGAARRCGAVLLLCSLAVTGCYRAAEIASGGPVPDMRIAAELTSGGADGMAVWIGPDAEAIEAHVIEWGTTEAVLSLLRVDHRGGQSIQWNGERVVFPVDALRNVHERTLNAGLTAGFLGGVAVAATLLALAFLRFLGTGDEGPGGGTDPPQ